MICGVAGFTIWDDVAHESLPASGFVGIQSQGICTDDCRKGRHDPEQSHSAWSAGYVKFWRLRLSLHFLARRSVLTKTWCLPVMVSTEDVPT